MHWGSIKIPCLRLTQWYLQRRSIKSPKRYFKVYALRVWVFFYRIWAPLCWQKWLRVWANYYLPLFYFPTGNLQFFVQMHSFFLMELHFVHNYYMQVEQYRLFCSYLFDFVLFSALLFYKDIMYVFLIKYELALD